ncbi:flagellar hook protein FlgE, putative [Oceanicola granulosus HTCC2516]|uniref:Flagellar hook protein FlgE n=1 Tax=Oceanicola granulosus (strain ATCC BAA-861 / DSM 15982 / KCTC 12143 / HTCC2516) TaxID=314256 RepID=Q2CJJ9_OCEGH|nr:flagellar hook-basal body complex protein [Oceanicola granulosus]EAR53140.1 flagellar hook protein FlgE, putative [Oceanicola granulosus HTCC2516]
MTISSSLNASVAGLTANASRLATIADNIANSSTFGYKRATTDFHSMVLNTTEGTYSAGGVRVTTQRLIDQRGSIVSTDNVTDLAVRGRGMMPVSTEAALGTGNASSQFLLTSTGSFRVDDQGYLASQSGLILMGWPAGIDGNVPAFPRDTADGLQPIRINANQSAGEATTYIDVGLNLPATSTEFSSTGEPEELTVAYYDNLGTSETLSITFTPTVPAAGSSNEWTMQITDSASAGAVVGEYTLVFDDTRGAGGTLASITPVSGGAYDPVTGRVTVNVEGGPLEVGLGLLGEPGGLTQLSDNFAPVSILKDGNAVGSMTSIDIDANGFMRAAFDTGISKVIYQIPLVDVSNVNGLETLDQQTYRATPESGSYFLWDAGDGPTGDLLSYALEESATDVAGELTELIQTQRAYSSNAKVIQTVDEMLQETTNIKR